MTNQHKTRCTLAFLVFASITTLLMLSCGGCGSGKVQVSDSNKIQNTGSISEQSAKSDKYPKQVSKSQDIISSNEYKKPEVHITRKYLNKEILLTLNPEHEGGDAWSPVWEEEVEIDGYTKLNRIIQLSPSVILYRRFPKEVAKVFYYADQPDKLEFLDSSYNTIRVVDIWKDRPYQDLKNVKLTYHNFDSEDMEVIPYKVQKNPVSPNEYSLFTYVRSEGKHVIVNYELRSIKNIKTFGMEGYTSQIVGIKHTLHIYDLQGNLKYMLKDLPSVDEAVVSNDGKFMMYTYGGIRLATANNPFATIERSGWALLRLEDQMVVYSEYTDDGLLAFARLLMIQNLIMLAYSTPSTEIDYDYWVFFDEKANSIFSHKLTAVERKIMNEDYNKSSDNFLYKNYFNKFKFDQILIK